jgi:pyruvate/2-oxoglutarate dehydrogenase complex dihydrolipoamide acyltransferase (E2) component
MSTKVNFPKSGMGIDDGILVAWLKSEGDPVTTGEVIAEVETAKVLQEIQAPIDGVLAKILVPVGETILVNTTLALID